MIAQIEDLRRQLEFDAARLDLLEEEIAAKKLQAEMVKTTMKVSRMCINALEDSLTLAIFRRERREQYPPLVIKPLLKIGSIEIID